MWNRLAGSLIYVIVYSPLIVLQTGLFFLLFIDKLIVGDFRGAFKALVLSPFQVFKMLFYAIALISMAGWQTGITGILGTNFTQIKAYFSDFYQTESRYFYAVQFSDYLGMYTGNYVGALASKLSLLYFPAAFFDFYKNYGYSPHNPALTLAANELYDVADREYGAKTKERLPTIKTEIEEYLISQQAAATNHEDRTYVLALACFHHLDKNFFSHIHDLNMKAEHNLVKSPLHVLSLVWQVIDDCYSDQPEQKAHYQALVATYLGNLQRGQSANTQAMDNPECGTGLINSLLGILTALDPRRFALQPSRTESWGKIQELLQEKMNQKYYAKRSAETASEQYMAHHNLHRPVPQPNENEENACAKAKQEFIDSNRSGLKYFALFLNNTPQGRAITGLPELDNEGVIATADEVLANWEPKDHFSLTR